MRRRVRHRNEVVIIRGLHLELVVELLVMRVRVVRVPAESSRGRCSQIRLVQAPARVHGWWGGG